MSIEQATSPVRPKGGRPKGYSPKQETPGQAKPGGVELSLDGDFITIKIPKKQLTKRLLAELI